MKSMRAQDANVHFVGVGGPKMRAEGMECLREAETLSVVGLIEVLKNFSFFKKALQDLSEEVLKRQVEAFIPIDFPDFNLRLCEKVKKHGVKVVYYVCPQVWAWRRSRVHQIARVVDVLLTIFPFEAKYFKDKDLRVEFIGHPLCDEIERGNRPGDPERGRGVLGLMPGSRHSEIDNHLPLLTPFIKEFLTRYPEAEIHIPCAQTLSEADLWNHMPELKGLKGLIVYAPGKSEEVLESCDAALIASGTSTLQGVLSNRPLSLFYRLNPITYWIGTKVIDLPYVGLANLVAGRKVHREYLQGEMTVENLLGEAEALMWDEGERKRMLDDFAEIHEKLGGPGASDRAAKVVLEA
jgi:lipid-A-disaccharide synthase